LRRALAIAVCGAVVFVPGGAASATAHTDVRITASDGAKLVATLVEPTAPGIYPAVLMMHGLGATRAQVLPLADQLAAAGYVVLAPDARGHGESGGLVDIDGPRTVQDVRELFDWLHARPEVDGARIAGWGVSYGGGALLRAAVDGVPFAVLETLETWSDLYSAVAPQNLSKSGAVYSLLHSVAPERTSPEVLDIAPKAIQSVDLPALHAFAAARSSRALLGRLTTPLYMFQGRRDFVFDVSQATAAIRLLKGPHRLYVGDFGHSPSKFPGPDVGAVMARGIAWFDQFLKPPHSQPRRRPVELAPDPWRGAVTGYEAVPATKRATFALRGTKTIGPGGVVIRSTAPTRALLETFGSSSVRFRARLSGGWSRVVAVVVARRRGKDTVVAEGGINTAGVHGARTLSIRLLDTATTIARGSRLRLYLGASSQKPDPTNLLYLDLGLPPGARLSVGPASVRLSVLRKAISRYNSRADSSSQNQGRLATH
jgi:fermentation-respiration switch protein FrsA (DUF1100 family)